MKTTSSRQKRKLDTRLRIIDAARECISQMGFSATSTVEIARKANVSHGSVFLHFPTKESLFLEVVESSCLKLAEGTGQAVKSAESLRDILSAHLDLLTLHEEIYTRIISELHLLPDGARRAYTSWQSAISHHFSLSAHLERDRKQIKDIPDHILFNTWIGLLHHYLLNKKLFAPKGSVLERYRDELLANFLLLLSTNNHK